MSKIYSKPGHGNSRFLYDGNGEVVGRGVTDSSGKTIYTGTNGQYIGKSYDMPSGTTKYVNSSNEYVGTGISHKTGISGIDCSGGAPIGNGTQQGTNTTSSLGETQSSERTTNKLSFRPAAYTTEYIVKSIVSIVLWAIFVYIVASAFLS